MEISPTINTHIENSLQNNHQIEKEFLELIQKLTPLIINRNEPLKILLKTFTKVCHSLIPCQYINFFTIEFNSLQSLRKSHPQSSFSLSEASILGSAFINNQLLIENGENYSKAFTEPTFIFDKSQQQLFQYDSICVIPIYEIGVLALYNKIYNQTIIEFTEKDFDLIQTAIIILQSLLEDTKPDFSPKRSLNDMYKQIFMVANNSECKQIVSKNIIQSIFTDKSCECLLENSIELINSLLNCESTRFSFKRDKNYITYLKGQSIFESLSSKEEERLFEELTQTFTHKINNKSLSSHLIAKFESETSTLIIEVSNKLDSLCQIIQFNYEDEEALRKLGELLIIAIESYFTGSERGFWELRNSIKSLASTLNSDPLISCIRTVSQELLDCERATLFIRHNDSMVVKSQGWEHDLPDTVSIPLGKGIIGSVAQTGKPENIEDAYKDERFNREIDLLTGFTTRSILSVPVFNNRKETIAVLEMINKIGGVFNEKDEELLELFSEMVGSVLQSSENFKIMIEEKTSLFNVLNSIGSYVIVLNKEGYLEYCNKSIKRFLGISQAKAKSFKYEIWLKENEQLLKDIHQVFEKISKKITRYQQKFKIRHLKKHQTDSILDTNPSKKLTIIDYTIVRACEITGDEAGVVIIIDDITDMAILKNKYIQMKKQLKAVSKPVKARNKLHSCIEELKSIQKSLGSTEFIEKIQAVISTLNEGNLLEAIIDIPNESQILNSKLESAIREYNRNFSPKREIRISVFVEEDTFLAASLKNWNQNFFNIEEEFPIVQQMLNAFNLISEFKIQGEVLKDFLFKIKEKYQAPGNPYHNFTHGLQVMHSSFFILSKPKVREIFSDHEVLAILISSLCHDVGHTGFTNNFEIISQSKLAILYNDKSVLENHHTSLTFRTIKKFNIFENISPELLKEVRKLIIECILATDMGKHFAAIAEMTSRFDNAEESPIGSLSGDSSKVAGFLVHCADIAHPTKDNFLCVSWSQLVSEEFSKQVETEEQLGLPITEFMKDLDEPVVYYKSEVNFLTVIARPLWECLNIWLWPDIENLMENLEENILFFEQQLATLEVNN